MLIKQYGTAPEAEKRYSPPVCVGTERKVVHGAPDPAHISTSFVERTNLTMPMHMRRFTRLTNGFFKKFETHCHMVALYAVWYNFIRIHKKLRITPAMQLASLTASIRLMIWSGSWMHGKPLRNPKNQTEPLPLARRYRRAAHRWIKFRPEDPLARRRAPHAFAAAIRWMKGSRDWPPQSTTLCW